MHSPAYGSVPPVNVDYPPPALQTREYAGPKDRGPSVNLRLARAGSPFGNPASSQEARGFASPPRDGFAFFRQPRSVVDTHKCNACGREEKYTATACRLIIAAMTDGITVCMRRVRARKTASVLRHSAPRRTRRHRIELVAVPRRPVMYATCDS